MIKYLGSIKGAGRMDKQTQDINRMVQGRPLFIELINVTPVNM